jgi:hypothetical protein
MERIRLPLIESWLLGSHIWGDPLVIRGSGLRGVGHGIPGTALHLPMHIVTAF